MTVNPRDLDTAWRMLTDILRDEPDHAERFAAIEDFRRLVIRDLDMLSGHAAYFADVPLRTLEATTHISVKAMRRRINRWLETSGRSSPRRPYREEAWKRSKPPRRTAAPTLDE